MPLFLQKLKILKVDLIDIQSLLEANSLIREVHKWSATDSINQHQHSYLHYPVLYRGYSMDSVLDLQSTL